MAVRLALMGRTADQVAAEVLLSPRQVRALVARYNADGPDALGDRPGRGRKGPLDADQRARLAERLRAGPTEAAGVCTPRGENVRQEFGVVRSLQAVYDLLCRMGLEPLRPRPRHPDADPAAQESFKKTSPAGSPRSPRPAPGSTSRSGSRTRRAPARRGR